jgi:PilZ domain
MNTISANDTQSCDQQTAQTETTCVAANQRSWMRLAKTGDSPPAIVSGSSGMKTAVIEDISMGGVGLRVADGAAFAVGQQVEIEFQEQTFGAVVRYKIDHNLGGHRVGMEWTQPTAPALQTLMKYLLAD